MRIANRFTTILSVIAAITFIAPPSFADQTVTCRSNGHKYTQCRIHSAGYVTLKRQLSKSSCIQGRTWDYDRRGIWVDDGCQGEFRVESSGRNNSKNSKKAAAALLGLAILGAMNENKKHNDNKHRDKRYQGSRHTSYVPSWMIGRFQGYNPDYNTVVRLRIRENGRVKAHMQGNTVKGWINDERLHIGSAVFDIRQIRRGFITNQRGSRHNEVRYRRVN